jgi:hypothetical protein
VCEERKDMGSGPAVLVEVGDEVVEGVDEGGGVHGLLVRVEASAGPGGALVLEVLGEAVDARLHAGGLKGPPGPAAHPGTVAVFGLLKVHAVVHRERARARREGSCAREADRLPL